MGSGKDPTTYLLWAPTVCPEKRLGDVSEHFGVTKVVNELKGVGPQLHLYR